MRDTGRVWIQAPRNVKEATSVNIAKKAIKDYCKKLPI